MLRGVVYVLLLAIPAALPATGQEPFVVTAGSGAEPAIGPVRTMAEAALKKLLPQFQGARRRPIRVMIHASLAALPAELRHELHPGTAGFARLGRDEMHVILEEAGIRPPHDLRTVVSHELVHVLLDQHAGRSAPFVPRWLHEGLAQHLSGAGYVSLSEDDLVFAVRSRTFPQFSSLEDDFPAAEDMRRLAYAQSFSFVSYVVEQTGLAPLIEAATACSADESYRSVFADITGVPLAELQQQWEIFVLDRSGAAVRFVLRNCFSYLMILAVPILALAAARRLDRERRRRMAMAASDTDQDDLAAAADDDDDDVDFDWQADPGSDAESRR